MDIDDYYTETFYADNLQVTTLNADEWSQAAEIRNNMTCFSRACAKSGVSTIEFLESFDGIHGTKFSPQYSNSDINNVKVPDNDEFFMLLCHQPPYTEEDIYVIKLNHNLSWFEKFRAIRKIKKTIKRKE